MDVDYDASVATGKQGDILAMLMERDCADRGEQPSPGLPGVIAQVVVDEASSTEVACDQMKRWVVQVQGQVGNIPMSDDESFLSSNSNLYLIGESADSASQGAAGGVRVEADQPGNGPQSQAAAADQKQLINTTAKSVKDAKQDQS